MLVIFYGLAAHKATYGRRPGGAYSKDYIQLSQEPELLEQVAHIFSVPPTEAGKVPLKYRWPDGSAPGDFVFQSADRPHLKWETNQGAPLPWRMTPTPGEATVETLPGDPGHTNEADADKEFERLADLGVGQPFLIAVKLKDEQRALHLRTYLRGQDDNFEWAALDLVPDEIQALAAKTRRTRALAWSMIKSSGIFPSPAVRAAVSLLVTEDDRSAVLDSLDVDTGRALAEYFRNPGDGLFFDPTRNHDSWVRPDPLPMAIAESIEDLLTALSARFPAPSLEDAAAEKLDVDMVEVEDFQQQIAEGSYAVEDAMATTKTRGSAQRAFADAVKTNYGYHCAITGITTKGFLVASHIVPWSKDPSIRLDPANGICLSLLVDRAFEKGYLTIDDDLTISINDDLVGGDEELRRQLQPYHGKALTQPAKQPPRIEYLQRRRELIQPGHTNS